MNEKRIDDIWFEITFWAKQLLPLIMVIICNCILFYVLWFRPILSFDEKIAFGIMCIWLVFPDVAILSIFYDWIKEKHQKTKEGNIN